MPSALLSRVDRVAARPVAWLDRRRLGTPVRTVLGLAVVGYPVLQTFAGCGAKVAGTLAVFASPWWLVAFFAAAILLVPLQRYRDGTAEARILKGLANVNGSFAGSIETIGQKLVSTKGRKLEDDQIELLCAGLLHRIRDYTALGLGVGERPRLRATLAVPYASTPGGEVDHLRVWCYDETHGDRGYTAIPLRIDAEVAPGAPAAYAYGIGIIHDIEQVPGVAARRALPYRSIVSLAVPATGPDGRPLAVVSIDADEPGFFEVEQVLRNVRPLVSPAINAIGLVLLSRRKKGQPYVFPR